MRVEPEFAGPGGDVAQAWTPEGRVDLRTYDLVWPRWTAAKDLDSAAGDLPWMMRVSTSNVDTSSTAS